MPQVDGLYLIEKAGAVDRPAAESVVSVSRIREISRGGQCRPPDGGLKPDPFAGRPAPAEERLDSGWTFPLLRAGFPGISCGVTSTRRA